MQEQVRAAHDIIALDRAANDDNLDEDGMAAMQVVAQRLLSWAKAQLKSTASLAAAAASGGAAGSSDTTRDVLQRDTLLSVATADDSGDAVQQPQQQSPTTPAFHSNSIISAAEWPQPQLLPRAGPDDWERWDFARRSGAAHKNQCGTGRADGSLDALQQMRTLTLICLQPGCSALVDYKVARRQAKQAGRVVFEAGDGCAGPLPCSGSHRAPRFRVRQLKTALELERGKRLLIRWPLDREDHEVWAYPVEAAYSAAVSARLALEEPAPKRGKRKREASCGCLSLVS